MMFEKWSCLKSRVLYVVVLIGVHLHLSYWFGKGVPHVWTVAIGLLIVGLFLESYGMLRRRFSTARD